MSAAETKTLLCKHMMSGAEDAAVEYEIDSAAKEIRIRMRTASGGKPFVSTALLADMIFISLPQRHEIEAFNDDDVDEWTPERTDWAITLELGDVARFNVVAWNQRPNGTAPQRTIEIYPIAEVMP